MENLFFDLQRGKEFKRHVSILNHLMKATQPLTIIELSELLDCSIPTVRTSIQLLDYQLGDFLKIQITSKGNASIVSKKNKSLDFLTLILVEETESYQIIHSILHNKKWTFQQASDQLAISRTSLLRIIQHMNKVLKNFNVAIQTSTLAFTGKEEDIRIFLFTFYSYFGKANIIWEEAEETASKLIAEKARLALPTLHLNHFRMSIWLSVLVARWKGKYFVTFSNGEKDMINDLEHFQRISQLFQQLYREYNVSTKLPDGELIWAYFGILHAVSYSDLLEPNRPDYIYHRPVATEIVAEIDELLAKILPCEQIVSEKADKLRAFLINAWLLTQLTPRFELIAPKLKIFMAEYYNTTYKMWLKALENVSFGSQLHFVHTDDIAAKLSILYISYFLLTDTKKKKVLLSFQGEAGFDDFLVKMAQSMVSDKVEICYFIGQEVTKEFIEEEGISYIMTNFDLHIADDSCPMMRLSTVPTSAEWGQARIALHDLAFN